MDFNLDHIEEKTYLDDFDESCRYVVLTVKNVQEFFGMPPRADREDLGGLVADFMESYGINKQENTFLGTDWTDFCNDFLRNHRRSIEDTDPSTLVFKAKLGEKYKYYIIDYGVIQYLLGGIVLYELFYLLRSIVNTTSILHFQGRGFCCLTRCLPDSKEPDTISYLSPDILQKFREDSGWDDRESVSPFLTYERFIIDLDQEVYGEYRGLFCIRPKEGTVSYMGAHGGTPPWTVCRLVCALVLSLTDTPPDTIETGTRGESEKIFPKEITLTSSPYGNKVPPDEKHPLSYTYNGVALSWIGASLIPDTKSKGSRDSGSISQYPMMLLMTMISCVLGDLEPATERRSEEDNFMSSTIHFVVSCSIRYEQILEKSHAKEKKAETESHSSSSGSISISDGKESSNNIRRYGGKSH